MGNRLRSFQSFMIALNRLLIRGNQFEVFIDELKASKSGFWTREDIDNGRYKKKKQSVDFISSNP